MSVSNIRNANSEHLIATTGFRLSSEIRTLAGDITLGLECAPVQYLDPGGAARNVDLPASVKGTVIVISNMADAAETITVRNEADATVDTVPQNQIGWFHKAADGAWRTLMVAIKS